MGDITSTGAQGLKARYAALLSARDVAWEAIEDAALLVTGEADCGRCVGVLAFEDVEAADSADEADPGEAVALIQLVWRLPLGTPPADRLPAVYELLALLGPDLPLARLELDPDDDGVRLRLGQLLPLDPPPSDTLLMAPLLESLNAVDEHHALVAEVLGGADPALAYVRFAVARARFEAEPVPDEERLRLLGLLRRATGRRAAEATTLEAVAHAVMALADL